MFRIRRLLLKLIWLADIALSPLHRLWLMVVCGADVSLLAAVRPSQLRGVRVCAEVIVEPFAMIEASGLSRIELEKGVIIQRNTHLLAYGGKISIGESTCVSRGCILYGHGGLTIGRDCLIGPGCIIVPANHVFEDKNLHIREQGNRCRGITIGDNVWLGARAVILDGVNIGDGCVIGAGTVVTDDLPANSVAAGVPARIIRSRM